VGSVGADHMSTQSLRDSRATADLRLTAMEGLEAPPCATREYYTALPVAALERIMKSVAQ